MGGRPKKRARGGAKAPGARGYSWPPFEPGNEVSTRHGAHSERKVLPIAAELAAGLVADRPDLERFPEAVAAWARAEARCVLIAEYQAERGVLDDDGNLRAGRYVAQLERLAADLRGRLGLDPRAEAELVRDRAEAAAMTVDLEALRERGRKVLDARSPVVLDVGPDGDEAA